MLRTALRGCNARNLYNSPRNGRSCSSVTTTNMMRPSPMPCVLSSPPQPVTSIFASHSGRRYDNPVLYERRRISKPTQTRLSHPAVFLQDCGSPQVRHKTKRMINPIRYRGPPHSCTKSSATSICHVVQRSPTRYWASLPIDPATRDQ